MKYLLPNDLWQILRKFGRYRLTGQDFMDLCNLCGIEYVFRRDIDAGFYYFTNGRPTIVVTTKGTAAYRPFVSWHEFAHHLQNYFRAQTGVSFLNVKPQSCNERHADENASLTFSRWWPATREK